MSVSLVKPRAASRAASRPFCAALPGCSGLDMVPKQLFSPAAWVPARPNAWVSASPSTPSSRAAAAAAPNVPVVAVVCQPLA